MNNGWRVYLLLCQDNTCYCGITKNLPRRIMQHNGLLPGGARYTRSRRPVALFGYIDAGMHTEALRLEATIKKLPRHKKLKCFKT